MNSGRRREILWHAMNAGPLWRARSAPGSGATLQSEGAEVAAQETAADVQQDEALQLDASRAAQDVALADRATAPGSERVTDGRAAVIARMPWPELESAVASCTACGLCKTRTKTVFGVGDRRAQWMLIGEAPGAEEDARGEPFVGQAGKLLDNMLAAVGLSRAPQAAGAGAAADGASMTAATSAAHSAAQPMQSVYIANVLKCRPPGNRNPEPEEVALCEPYLQRQVALVEPRLIVVMGRFAAQALLGTDATIASLRGRVHQVQVEGRAIPVIVTYHPAYLLRNLADKAKSWADLCLAASVLARQGER
jgi:DNA polymerase